MEEFVACYYDYDDFVFLKGYVENKNLVIIECIEEQKSNIDTVFEKIKSTGLKPMVYAYEPLVKALNEKKCDVYNFNELNQIETDNLLKFFNSLKDNGKIIIRQNVDVHFQNAATVKAFQLLLKVTMDALVKESLKFSGGLGNVRPEYKSRHRFFG